jgi:hypothetical protein
MSLLEGVLSPQSAAEEKLRSEHPMQPRIDRPGTSLLHHLHPLIAPDLPAAGEGSRNEV